MNEYARARGIAFPENTDAEAIACVPKRPLRELTAREMEIIARRRELVHAHMPEMLPIIKDLVENGLIDGWRNVGPVTVFATGEVA